MLKKTYVKIIAIAVLLAVGIFFFLNSNSNDKKDYIGVWKFKEISSNAEKYKDDVYKTMKDSEIELTKDGSVHSLLAKNDASGDLNGMSWSIQEDGTASMSHLQDSCVYILNLENNLLNIELMPGTFLIFEKVKDDESIKKFRKKYKDAQLKENLYDDYDDGMN